MGDERFWLNEPIPDTLDFQMQTAAELAAKPGI
jgi:hypothetical protein